MSTAEKHQFQAEIQQLLDIVIHSLYTDREVFVRELVSNAADACEKLRFLQTSGQPAIQDADQPLGITLQTDEAAGTLTITDTGIGMSNTELVENLGTIAHSGTKAFLKVMAEKQKPDAHLIGQFGVGFYSAFMVAKKVTVLTRSHRPEDSGWRWTSEGGNGYELEPAADLTRGTKIVLELKDDAKDFTGESKLEGIIKRYSNFVTFPIDLNTKRINTVQAIWARSKNEVKEEEYTEFYKYIGHDSEAPAYRLHFSADAPLSIQALLFVPASNMETMGLTRTESEVHLYCRKVLIESRAKGLLPDWLRFLRGVVDSEDLPLNVSRERMQDSELMKKLNKALTNRFLKFLDEQSGKDADAYGKFYKEYSRFLKEGILSDYDHRAALGKLLRFESSTLEKDKTTSLAEYVSRLTGDQKDIYYLHAANRQSAESSPYFEVFKSRSIEVLFVYDPIDEFVMDRLIEFDGKNLTAAEKADLKVTDPEKKDDALTEEQSKALAAWMKEKLGDRVNEVRISERLVGSPVVALEHDQFLTATMRKTLKMMGRENEAGIGSTDLELNPRHAILVRLDQMRQTDEALAIQVSEQLFDNARMSAGLLEDPRSMLTRLNTLLEKVLTAKA
ncbi:MAG TPA: molecular chaperone HtpG [Roseimicrobium sp.]|nr:molecular chaperone HtpG [Roseimicrobium sp.]